MSKLERKVLLQMFDPAYESREERYLAEIIRYQEGQTILVRKKYRELDHLQKRECQILIEVAGENVTIHGQIIPAKRYIAGLRRFEDPNDSFQPAGYGSEIIMKWHGFDLFDWQRLLPLQENTFLCHATFLLQLLQSAIEGLYALHQMKFIHCDIKADNLCIALDPESLKETNTHLQGKIDPSRLKIIDLGLCFKSGSRDLHALPKLENFGLNENDGRCQALLEAYSALAQKNSEPLSRLDWRLDCYDMGRIFKTLVEKAENSDWNLQGPTSHRFCLRKLVHEMNKLGDNLDFTSKNQEKSTNPPTPLYLDWLKDMEKTFTEFPPIQRNWEFSVPLKITGEETITALEEKESILPREIPVKTEHDSDSSKNKNLLMKNTPSTKPSTKTYTPVRPFEKQNPPSDPTGQRNASLKPNKWSVFSILIFLSGFLGVILINSQTPIVLMLPLSMLALALWVVITPNNENEENKISGEGRRKQAPPQTQMLKPSCTNSIGMEFILIPDGDFKMGSLNPEKSTVLMDEMQHSIKITAPFYLGKYEVTQGQWKTVMGEKPKNFKEDNYPVTHVTWVNAQEFIKKLNQSEGHNRYRLPTEAEWEYAARAGTTTAYSFGDDSDQLEKYAWYAKNSASEIKPVGERGPNPWGLYDMYGNVWEWIQDWYGKDYYTTSPERDPKGPSSGDYRVLRGGSWSNSAWDCRSVSRANAMPGYQGGNIGFRLALSIDQ